MFRKWVHIAVKTVLGRRMKGIDLVRRRGLELQEDTLKHLLHRAKNTEYGKKYGFSSIANYEQYKKRVPTTTYEEFFPYIDRTMKGEHNLIWPTIPMGFSRTSGTTNDHSKYVPLTREAFKFCHAKATKDFLAAYLDSYPESRFVEGYTLYLPGDAVREHPKAPLTGDLSALMRLNAPRWMEVSLRPPRSITKLGVWEKKMKLALENVLNKNVTCVSGIPIWVIALMKAAMEAKGCKNVCEIWPRLEVFFHGGVPFDSYEDICRTLIPDPDMRYFECYMASEGYIAFQDQRHSKDLLICLNHGMFFEFADTEDEDNICSLAEIECNKNYAVLLSTNAGLWRYRIGDIVRFVSTNPYRIRVVGRTKHYISIFGEHLVDEVASEVLKKTCQSMPEVIVNEFTAAPRAIERDKKGRHEWVIEFVRPPKDMPRFQAALDDNICRANSEYDARRKGPNSALDELFVHSVPQGTFHRWMKERDRLGGQYKVPRLSNQRHHVESILTLTQNSPSTR